ncbi:S8 family serine peptidase [Cellulomonas sp. DKR-3]|uniref:S8 family serine peptidase n=1 Tax=Cellulomonas fulva TaxID=2835530 RepID=A0ABS5TYP6_9CELL|nr:S8/S53 family peptidase [Cellulomonas fulva]MBT0994258.1 S8 family serine peptidase [Cellulomonas fulva]
MTARPLLRRRSVAALACAAALGCLGVAPATAAGDSDGGMWYFTKTGMDAIHERTTGKGVHVAIIDTAIAPDSGDLRGADLTVHEPSFCAEERGGDRLPAAQDTPAAAHGTGMSALVVGTGKGLDGEPGTLGIAPDATVTFYSALVGPEGTEKGVCEPFEGRTNNELDLAILQAVEDGADIISISLNSTGGWGEEGIAPALASGAIIVAAVTSDEKSPALGYPAQFNGVVAVDSIGPDGKVWGGAPSGTGVVAPGEDIHQLDDDLAGYSERSGSSNATAYTAGALALVKSAYPDATTNQLLQALVRNTNGEEHEIYRDDFYGFGTVNVRQMLEQDPAKYPDESPFLDHDELSVPTYEQVMALTTPSAEPTPSATPAATAGATAEPSAAPSAAPPAAEDADDGSAAPLAWAGLGGVALAAVATALILVARRRGAAADAPTAAVTDGGTDDPHRPHETGGG